MEYPTVDGTADSRYEIHRSVFIGNVKGINSFDEGMDFVKEISKKYSDATHNCYAVITKDGQQKFSDDGEPQGTAGMPILQVLKKSGLTDVVAVVTRYFGGIKLGAGGLVASYTACVADAVTTAKKITVRLCDILDIPVSYTDYRKISEAVSLCGKVINADFSDGVILRCAVPVEKTAVLTEKLNELTAGKLTYEKFPERYEKFDK